MSKKQKADAPELVCIECDGGAADASGAYTLCALCALAEAA